MNTPPTAAVLILAADEAAGQRWAEMLRGPGCQVWFRPEDVPADVEPEVILTDRDASDPRPAAGLAGVDRRRVGIIRIGGLGEADVWLPDDATGRELRLACRLLAEVVRLRRKDLDAAKTHRRLAQGALTDPLTGLPNRRAWDEALARRRRQPDAGTCVAILDLDHFKRVNDTRGHAAGDEVLRATGVALRDGLRQGDFVARLGGDEFGLLLSVPDASTAAVVLDRVRAALPQHLVRQDAARVTASIGFYCPRAGDASSDNPVEIADAALRRAKQEGRDRTVEA
ncbi:MAG: GGDEF domain-containing protein [Planctomycetia bacterium]|nr:GGDEF domain-containing protein [Planctomycetia bacterium]